MSQKVEQGKTLLVDRPAAVTATLGSVRCIRILRSEKKE